MRLPRRPWPIVALFTGLLVSSGSADQPDPVPATTVEVLLTVAPTLPAPARHVLIDEAAAIWAREDVAIEWLSPTNVLPPAPNRLRVLVVPRAQPDVDEASVLTVARLVRPDRGHAVAFASMDNAARIIGMAPRRSILSFGADDRRLGLVLGRAVAHEIGHYLLDTATHARVGLMRARFHPREFTDFGSDAFLLDPDGAASLKARLYSMNP
jgi:hypothetical protein